MSLDFLCRWQVQVSVYCAWRIPAHLRCTQCSILLHLMDICFLTCICLWQISQIQTFLFKVVGPGLVSTSPAFVSSSASHPAGPHGMTTDLIMAINNNPVFNPVAPYRYIFPTVYLFVGDLLACGCRTWISINIARMYEEQCHPSIV